MTRWGAYRGLSRSKYNNRPTRCAQGVMHHSALEADHCNKLHALQSGGIITGLEAHPQPSFHLEVNGVHVCDYRADFAWQENGERVVADSKGIKTAEFRIKERLMLGLHGIEVKILGKNW